MLKNCIDDKSTQFLIIIMPALFLTIGNVSVKVESESDPFIRDISIKHRHFVDQRPRHLTAAIQIIHKTYPCRDNIIVTNENDTYIIDGGEFKGHFCLKSNVARFAMKAEASLFNSFLRVFYSLLLTKHNGFLVHAAGLKKDDNAYLFTGPSSSGKTTTVTIADDCSVLNDELTLVRKVGDVFYLFATPFTGNYDRPIKNCSAALKGLFFLDKQLNSAFEPVERSKCLVKLLENVFFFDTALDANQHILDLCHQLVSQQDGFNINILSRDNLWGLINEIGKEYSYT